MILAVLGVSYFTSYAQGTYEVNTGSARTGVDVIYSTSIDSIKHWPVLSRNIASLYHDQSTSLVSFNSIAYSFKSGLGIASNNIFTPSRFYTAIGIQYILSRKEVFLYVYLTKEISSNNFYDHFIFFAWQPHLRKNLKLLLQNELNFTLYGFENDNSLERFKAGLNYANKFQFGLMMEVASSKKSFQVNYENLGVFIKKII